jgi:DNA polymerase III epsilon subunit-like protein
MALPLRDATSAVIDVETTGIDPSVDRVVEVACAVVRDGKETDAFSSLINPGRSIPAAASAVHHLTNRHVQNAPSLGDVRPKLAAMCAGTIVVAHNARFDLGFLPFLADRPVRYSMRLAMRVLPDAPNYKNQILRGVSIERVPADYLLWLYRKSSSASGDARSTAERELQRRAIAS